MTGGTFAMRDPQVSITPVPLSSATLATLAPEQRTEGAGLYNLSRNIGSSIGISIVNALLTTNTQVNHAEIATHVTAVNRAFENPLRNSGTRSPGRTRGPRRGVHSTVADHRIARRLQTFDDRDARGHSAAAGLQKGVRQLAR
jgi:hypothetical protein